LLRSLRYLSLIERIGIPAEIGGRCSFIVIGHCYVLLSGYGLVMNLGSTHRYEWKLTWNSSLLCQRMGQHCCVGESTQTLEIPLTNRPDVSERHIHGHGCFSGLSLDATERDDSLARSDELVCDEVNVKSSIEVSEKALEHVLKALEMAAAHGHPFRHIVYDVRRLETAQRLAMSWDGSFVESANALLVFFSHFLPSYECAPRPTSLKGFQPITKSSSVRQLSLLDFLQAPNVQFF
jgi:hypothetical protein